MSANTVSKLDIDVLVDLAMNGPLGATHWVPLADDADALGSRLRRQNLIAVNVHDHGEPGIVEDTGYVFAALPFAVTAEEGLKHCSYYRYQTADDEERWATSFARSFIERLVSGLLNHIASKDDDAPWGWGDADIQQRLTVRPLRSQDSPPDPEIAAAHSRLLATGIPFQSGGHRYPVGASPANPRVRGNVDDVIAQWVAWGPEQGEAPAAAFLMRSEDAARTVFAELCAQRHLRGSMLWVKSHEVVFFRVGRLVMGIEHSWPGTPSAEWAQRLRADFFDADEEWSQYEEVEEVTGTEVVAVRLEVAPVGRSGRGAVVARTEKSLQRLCSFIQDSELRNQIAATDLSRHSVILATGLPAVTNVSEATLKTYRRSDSKRPTDIDLVYPSADNNHVVGTVLITDRLPATPARINIGPGPWFEVPPASKVS